VGSLLEISFLFSGMVEGFTSRLLAGCSMGVGAFARCL